MTTTAPASLECDHEFGIIYEQTVDTSSGCRALQPCEASVDLLEEDLHKLGSELLRQYSDQQQRPTSRLCGVDLIAGYTCHQMVSGADCGIKRTRTEVRPASHMQVTMEGF